MMMEGSATVLEVLGIDSNESQYPVVDILCGDSPVMPNAERECQLVWDIPATVALLVSAWAQANHLVLAPQAVDHRSHEITAMPKLRQMRDLAGGMVIRDRVPLGWGCQTRIAQQIRDQEADCVLAVKGNPQALQARIQDTLAYAQTQGFVDGPHDDVETVHKDHGRVETRRCGTIGAPDYGRYVDPHPGMGRPAEPGHGGVRTALP